MRAPCVFAALSLLPSDSQRDGPMPVGMAGLRHKPRHKKSASFCDQVRKGLVLGTKLGTIVRRQKHRLGGYPTSIDNVNLCE